MAMGIGGFCRLALLAVIFATTQFVTEVSAVSKRAVTPSTAFASISAAAWGVRGGGVGSRQEHDEASHEDLPVSDGGAGTSPPPSPYGRVSDDEYILTPEQIETFRRDGCVTIPNVLTAAEVEAITAIFDRFVAGDIPVPGKDFCDMSKPFGIPYEEWSIVNCMLPTKYYPPLQGNIYERLATSMARQLFPASDMVKDYDQLLNKRAGCTDAVFAWHQDMAYWPGSQALGVSTTDTCTFSLALDDSDPENGCLRYIPGSGVSKTLRAHRPLCGDREEGHALVIDVGEDEEIRLAPAKSGSITIHDEYVVHGSDGNRSTDRQRRTYVVAFRAREIVDAERRIGFTHSHNDQVNWDTFQDGESHRVKILNANQKPLEGTSSSDEK